MTGTSSFAASRSRYFWPCECGEFFYMRPCSHIINAAEELKSLFHQAVTPEEETGGGKQHEPSSAEGSACAGCSQE